MLALHTFCISEIGVRASGKIFSKKFDILFSGQNNNHYLCGDLGNSWFALKSD